MTIINKNKRSKLGLLTSLLRQLQLMLKRDFRHQLRLSRLEALQIRGANIRPSRFFGIVVPLSATNQRPRFHFRCDFCLVHTWTSVLSSKYSLPKPLRRLGSSKNSNIWIHMEKSAEILWSAGRKEGAENRQRWWQPFNTPRAYKILQEKTWREAHLRGKKLPRILVFIQHK